ncbi:MAG: flavin reductase family protein [Bacillota bacterium]
MHKEIDIKKMKFNPFTMIGEEWMLIAAGDENDSNMMTASWGGLGVLWHKNVATAYIRPTRHTLKFVEEKEYFSLCFLGENKAAYKVCGSKSGRDTDKAKEANLTPIFENGTVYYKESRLVFICKKIYHSTLDNKNFLDESIESLYSGGDYHKIFVGEIVKVLENQDLK